MFLIIRGALGDGKKTIGGQSHFIWLDVNVIQGPIELAVVSDIREATI